MVINGRVLSQMVELGLRVCAIYSTELQQVGIQMCKASVSFWSESRCLELGRVQNEVCQNQSKEFFCTWHVDVCVNASGLEAVDDT